MFGTPRLLLYFVEGTVEFREEEWSSEGLRGRPFLSPFRILAAAKPGHGSWLAGPAAPSLGKEAGLSRKAWCFPNARSPAGPALVVWRNK